MSGRKISDTLVGKFRAATSTTTTTTTTTTPSMTVLPPYPPPPTPPTPTTTTSLPSFRYNKADDELIVIPPPPPPPPPYAPPAPWPKRRAQSVDERASSPIMPPPSSTPSSSSAVSQPIDLPTNTREVNNDEEDEEDEDESNNSVSSVEPSPPNATSTANTSINIGHHLLDTQLSNFSLREPSPIKEAILTKFARLAPSSSSSSTTTTSATTTAASTSELGSSLPFEASSSSSWLHQVKGKIAKTVEEKYTEYRSEREIRRQMRNSASATTTTTTPNALSAAAAASVNSSIDGGGESGDEEGKVSSGMSHSLSEASGSLSSLTSLGSSSLNTKQLSQSQNSLNNLPLSETTSAENGGGGEDGKTPVIMIDEDGPPKSPSNKERKGRFHFSFLDKSARTASTEKMVETSEQSSSQVQTPSSVPPRESLRTRMMERLSRKRGNNNLSSSPTSEDPFSGVIPPPVPVDVVEEALEADEKLVFDPAQDPSEEADDVYVDEEEDGGSATAGSEEEQWWFLSRFWWAAALPLCVILFLQLLPLPSWFIGFVTGLLIGVPGAVYLMWTLFVREALVEKEGGGSQGGASPGGSRFIVNVRRRVPKRPAIIVQEELERKYTWMNMWPAKNGPYDPLTYDVRRTMSVRVMLHGPWIELKFPRRNLPLRRMHDDVEPKNVDFYDHKEVLDLTNCSIELTPENLPSKRVWSKKYPIKITTLVRKPCSEDQDQSSKEVVPTVTDQPVPDPAEIKQQQETKSDGLNVRLSTLFDKLDQDFNLEVNNEEEEEEQEMHDAVWDPSELDSKSVPNEKVSKKDHDESDVPSKDNDEDKNNVDEKKDDDVETVSKKDNVENDEEEFEILQESSRSFYLFTRTSREKEEWFNRLTVGARFMQDWNHQNPPPTEPKERTAVRPDVNYETFKVKEQRFRVFMENYFQARHAEGASKVHDEILKDPSKCQVAKEQVAFLNIFGARLWHDLHSSKTFIDLLREKLTRKLLKVKIAQYFEEVSVTTLDLGTQLPQILSASLPWQDENGLWANLEIEYHGICQATVETQGIRLPGKDEPDREAQEITGGRQAATVDSDEEDSAEDDDDVVPESSSGDPTSNLSSGSNNNPSGGCSEGQVHGSGFRVRVLEGLLRSEFVAKVAESEWVKKNITGRNITLQLQLHVVRGTLTINLPPAPSDRIWYCFRSPPHLELALRPCFGGKSLGKYESTFSAVMRLLEKRLKQEFMKVVVYPNMDDEVLPFLDHVSYSLKS